MGNARRPLIRLAALASLAILLGHIPIAAQTAGTIVNVNVSANVKGATFWVDGREYASAASFLWPAGSKHLLEIRSSYQPYGDGRSRLTFTGWQTTGSAVLSTSAPVQTITADVSATSFTAQFSVEHRVAVYVDFDPLRNLLDPTAIDLKPITETELPLYANKSGFVVAGGQAACAGRAGLPTSTWFWMAQGSALNLYAYPYPGKVFSGWQNPPGPASPAGSLLVAGPVEVRARFSDARRIFLDSSPVKELKVLVDRSQVYTRGDKCWPDWSNFFNPNAPYPPNPPDYSPVNNPVPPYSGQVLAASNYCTQIPLCNGELDLEPGTAHVFAAPPSQTDRLGNVWVFDHWNFGGDQNGGQNSVVTIPDAWQAHTYTAFFVKGIRSSFVTVPTGLKLKIDGRDNWPAYNFDWGLGHKHTVSAPLEQTDAKGRRYRFIGWDNEGPADQEVTIAEGANTPGSFRMIARYELMGQLTLRSDPTSMTFNVNGEECRTPCTIDKPAGTEVTIQPLLDFPFSDDTRAVFDGWTDGAAAKERTYTFGTEAAMLTAKYRYLQKLTTIADPEQGADWVLEPAPESGNWFPAGTRLSVTANARRGYKFKRFEGALTGMYNTGWLTMNAPATVVARLEKTPALQDAAVRNAAGETPDQVVAPGSLISVKGVNLTSSWEKGPDNPLKQTIQGVTIQVAGRILPLVLAGPDEVVAQLPSDLEEGSYKLTLRSTGYPTLTADFTVARNAPGLFRAPEAPEETPLALALHADGTAITLDNPAKVGETVTILGTGFGPSDPQPLDGFAVPADPPAPLKDTLELLVGGEVRPHEWAGAAPGMVGYAQVKVKIDSTMGQAQNLDIRIRVNGRESNAILLPVQ